MRRLILASCLTAALAGATAQGNSLWPTDRGRELYVDHKATRVGDIVTILIQETSNASKEATTTANKDSKVKTSLAAMIFPKIGTHSGVSPEIDISTKNEYTGEGTTERKDTFTARMAASVMDILPSGNLVIEGQRVITLHEERQVMVLRGIVRSEDISADNTVLSSAIADAEIEYTGKGVITEKQRPGIVQRVMDWLWIF